MYNLSLYPITENEKLVWPAKTELVTMDSSAVSVFTDFRQFTPLVVDESTSAVATDALMKKAHVRMKLVVNHQNELIGIVSSQDISERKIVQKVAQGYARDELMVTDFMQKRADIRAFDYHQLLHARVADVINALKNNGHQHCLVVDKANEQICGVISASDIARRLQLPVDITQGATFLDIFTVVTGKAA